MSIFFHTNRYAINFSPHLKTVHITLFAAKTVDTFGARTLTRPRIDSNLIGYPARDRQVSLQHVISQHSIAQHNKAQIQKIIPKLALDAAVVVYHTLQVREVPYPDRTRRAT